MDDNPYQSPQTSTDASGVVVRSRFPLDIVGDRTLITRISAVELSNRVHEAAQSGGYSIGAHDVECWTLRRGSHWDALYTFNIRKVPTTVVIQRNSMERIHIHLHCRSCLQISISKARDKQRIASELEFLERTLAYHVAVQEDNQAGNAVDSC